MRFQGAVMVLPLLAVSGCAFISDSASGEVPRATGDDPSISAQVDCGEDGVANVRVEYGVTDETVLVGRPSLTQSAGGRDSFDNKYANTPDGVDEVLTVTTEPTTGTCTTRLTDYESGGVLAEKSTSGKAVVSAVVPGGQGEGETSSVGSDVQAEKASNGANGKTDNFGSKNSVASEQDFLSQISDPFWAGSPDANLIDLGSTICETLDEGSTTTEVLLAMQDGETEASNPHVEMLYAAVSSFCPEYLEDVDI